MNTLSRLSTTLALCTICHAQQAFDYVIAGGGTAGLVIANRLSEDPGINVAVIEPGDDVRGDPDVNNVDLAGISFSPLLDWNYNSTVQPQLANRVLAHHAGKALGGTTVINGMYYMRGDRENFDAWEALGNPGWNWDTLFPYFKRSEDFSVPSSAQLAAGVTYVAKYHGEGGPLSTGQPYQVANGSFHDLSLTTCESLGFYLNQDLNGGHVQGYGAFAQTLDRDANVRDSSARAYYLPVEDRSNLQVIKGTIKKITFSESAGSKLAATGFEYTDDQGSLTSIIARREVVLSAGTFVTPLILESSGIGNSRVLNRNKIEVKLNLPGVGEGFQDQPLWVLMFESLTNITGHIPFAAFATARNIFGSNTDSIATRTRRDLASWANIVSERLTGGVSVAALETRFRIQHAALFNTTASMVEYGFFAFSNIVGISFSPTLPFSWGSVHIDAVGAVNNPAIDSNFLTLDFDVQTAIAAGKLARKIYSTKPLSDLAGSFVAPGYETLPSNATDEEWTQFLVRSDALGYHGVGTCAMLPRNLGGVVDPTLKVYGTANIRVVDASVIPHLMSGHPSAAVYALAERAADMIKGDLATGTCPACSGMVFQPESLV